MTFHFIFYLIYGTLEYYCFLVKILDEIVFDYNSEQVNRITGVRKAFGLATIQ